MLTVSIITPERQLPEQQANHVTLPAFDGQVGIRPGHAPFICQLGSGTLYVKSRQSELRYLVVGGVAEIADDHVRVLAEQVEAVSSGER